MTLQSHTIGPFPPHQVIDDEEICDGSCRVRSQSKGSTNIRRRLTEVITCDAEDQSRGHEYVARMAKSACLSSIVGRLLGGMCCFSCIPVAVGGISQIMQLSSKVGSEGIIGMWLLMPLNFGLKVLGVQVGGALSRDNSFERCIGVVKGVRARFLMRVANWVTNFMRALALGLHLVASVALLAIRISEGSLDSKTVVVFAIAQALFLWTLWIACTVTFGLFMPNAWAVIIACSDVSKQFDLLEWEEDVEGQQPIFDKILRCINSVKSMSEDFTRTWEFYFLVAEALIVTVAVAISISVIQIIQWVTGGGTPTHADWMLIGFYVYMAALFWAVVVLVLMHGVVLTAVCERVALEVREKFKSHLLTIAFKQTDVEDALTKFRVLDDYAASCSLGFKPYGIPVSPKLALSAFYAFITIALTVAFRSTQ